VSTAERDEHRVPADRIQQQQVKLVMNSEEAMHGVQFRRPLISEDGTAAGVDGSFVDADLRNA